MAQQSRPALQALPLEILDQIAFELVALQPLGPPCDLLPLLLTSSHFHQALGPGTNPVLFARIFRHKFDTRAVARRAFAPSHIQCMEQLVHYCRTMQVLRAGDVYVEPRAASAGAGGDDEERSATDALFTAFMMMLEDDGKNARQLSEWACADVFAERFVRRRLFEDRERNDGWPVESAPNSCALWLMWMLTTEEKLRNETDAQREQMIQLLLPFVFVSLRYASSEAPPHFFSLPLPTSLHSPLPQSISSAHGTYPVYPSPQRDFSQIHYATRPVFSPPLAAPAAKLLYFARRELRPLPIPPHLAPNRAALHARGNFEVGPTVEDMHELNWSWTARLPSERPADAHDSDSSEEWGPLLPAAPSVSTPWEGPFGGSEDPASRWFGKAPPLGVRGGKSRAWDADWWRLRLCGDPRRANPSVRYGRVYEPGCMDGLWVGRMLVSAESVTSALMLNTEHPGSGVLNDSPPYTMQAPIYMRLREAHGVHGELASALPCTRAPNPGDAEEDAEAPFDDGISNAWFAGRTGGVRVSDDWESGGGRVLVEAEGGRAGRGVYRCWDAQAQARGEWAGYVHEAAACEGCRAREEVRERARRAEAAAAGEREALFRSVGLGMGVGADGYDGDEDPEEEEYYDEEGEGEGEVVEGGEEEPAEPEWDPVEEGDDPALRAHCRSKVLPCDGIKDIVLFGATDERHGQAFNHFTYYGRVRPWDGLVGILSRARDDSYGYLFFYGYLVGGKNFVGNWRITSEDPAGPVWESAFAMSRRGDD